MDRTETAAALQALATEVEQRHPGACGDIVFELIAYNEHRVAFEILCDRLCELTRELDAALHGRLAAVGTALGVPADYWEWFTATG
jgi:hypothetical protein